MFQDPIRRQASFIVVRTSSAMSKQNKKKKSITRFPNMLNYVCGSSKRTNPTYQTPRQRRIKEQELNKMPDTTIFPSTHVAINKERVGNNVPKLTRCGILDEIARNHASYMLQQTKVTPFLDKAHYLPQFRRYSTSSLTLNVSHSSTIQDSQRRFMRSKNPKKNILNKDFEKMGVGTAQDEKGKLYVCQVFAGSA